MFQQPSFSSLVSLPSHQHRPVFPFLHICCHQMNFSILSISPTFLELSFLSTFLVPPSSCLHYTNLYISIHLGDPFPFIHPTLSLSLRSTVVYGLPGKAILQPAGTETLVGNIVFLYSKWKSQTRNTSHVYWIQTNLNP